MIRHGRPWLKIRSVARVLAIDIGTSSIRATLYGQSLQPVRQGTQVRYRWRVGSDGSVEAEAAAIERTVAQAIDGALDGVKTPRGRRGDRRVLAQPGRRGRAGPARHVGHPVERHAQRAPGPVAARTARRTRHPRAHGMPAASDLLAGAPAVVRRPRGQDVPPRPPVDVLPGVSPAPVARARRGEPVAGVRHRHVPARRIDVGMGSGAVRRVRRHARISWARSSISMTPARAHRRDRAALAAAPRRAVDSGRGRWRARQRRGRAARPADAPPS